MSKLASKVVDILNSAHEESGSQNTDDDAPLHLHMVSSNGRCQYSFESNHDLVS